VPNTLTRWQHFSAWNDVIAANLNVWHQIKNPTPSVSAYLLEEHSCQISSQSDLKWRSLRLFWRGHPNNKKNKKMSSDMRSVPELKMPADMQNTVQLQLRQHCWKVTILSQRNDLAAQLEVTTAVYGHKDRQRGNCPSPPPEKQNYAQLRFIQIRYHIHVLWLLLWVLRHFPLRKFILIFPESFKNFPSVHCIVFRPKY